MEVRDILRLQAASSESMDCKVGGAFREDASMPENQFQVCVLVQYGNTSEILRDGLRIPRPSVPYIPCVAAECQAAPFAGHGRSCLRDVGAAQAQLYRSQQGLLDMGRSTQRHCS